MTKEELDRMTAIEERLDKLESKLESTPNHKPDKGVAVTHDEVKAPKRKYEKKAT